MCGEGAQVWKTHMGRNRGESTLGALRAIYREGGGGFPGIAAFWAGTAPKASITCHSHALHAARRVRVLLMRHGCVWRGPVCRGMHCVIKLGKGSSISDSTPLHAMLQMVESASKGAILMYSKEAILKVLSTGNINPGAWRTSI